MTFPRLYFIGMLCLLFVFVCEIRAQEEKFSLEFQLAPIHYYFNQDPILNVNYPHKVKGLDFIFNDFFFSSKAITLSQPLKNRFRLNLGYSKFSAFFKGHTYTDTSDMPIILAKYWKKVFISFLYKSSLNSKWSIWYGGGLNFRFGYESVALNEYGFDLITARFYYKDIGALLTVKPRYQIHPFVYAFSELNYCWFFSLNGRNDKPEIQKVFPDHDLSPFPSRHDLSFHVGIGIEVSKMIQKGRAWPKSRNSK